MRKTPVVSLRVFLALLVGLLVVIALGFASNTLWQNWQLSRKVQLLVERNRIADDCLQSVANFAFERGRTNIILRAEGPVSPENRQFIDERRRAADRHIASALENLPASAEERGEAVRKAWEEIGVRRSEADHDMMLPLDRRNPQLPKKWMADSDRLIDRVETLLVTVSGMTGDVDATFDRLAGLRVLALHFRILVGKQSSLVGALLSSGQVPNAEALTTIREIRGGIDQLWPLLESSAEVLEDAAVFQSASWAQSRVFWTLRPLQDDILLFAETRKPTSVTLDHYLKAAVEALDATVALADAINRRADSYAQRLLDRVRWQIAASASIIVGVLVLSGFVVWRFRRRFTQPLNDVMRHIDALLKSQSGVSGTLSLVDERDELGMVQRALEMLDEVIAVRMHTEKALRESEAVNSSILACAPQAIISTDLNGVITAFSPGAEKMLGYSATEMLGQQTPLLFHDADEIRARADELSVETGAPVAAGFDVFVTRLQVLGDPDESEWRYVRKDGGRLTVMLAVTFLRDAVGEIRGCLGVATDVTERAAAATRIAQMAYHDHLTQLPNARLLYDRLQVALAQSRRDGGRLAVMQVDLDRFKPVNDRFGHDVGDLLLKEVAVRMLSCLRSSDTLARVGGDEFVVVLPGVGVDQDALGVAEKIRQCLSEPFELESHHVVSIACSIGVAIFPEHGADEKHLRKCADEAMYLSKANGRNCVTLFGGVPQAPLLFVQGGDASLVRLAWHRSFQCGETVIDQEHRKLFEDANRVLAAMVQGVAGSEEPARLLDDLVRDVAAHFQHEEQILADFGYADLSAHRLRHHHLLERVGVLRERAAAGILLIGELASFVVQEVVFQHILNEDMAYFQFLRHAMHQQRTESDERSEI